MHPQLHKVSLNPQESIYVQVNMAASILKQWHYHDECEVLNIRSGTGRIFIGDHVSTFREGDVFLIGSKVPHMLRTDPSVDAFNPDEIIFIHLCTSMLSSLISLPENRRFQEVFSRASHGIKISGSAAIGIAQLIKSSTYARETEKLIILLQVLNAISNSKEFELVSSTSLYLTFNNSDDTRLNKIYNFTLLNFQKTIPLQIVADLVYLCPHSFCRYFKSRTRRNYSSFLTEIRISHACKLLSETDYSIGVVSYESGFMNLSNFNRQFKIVKGRTPLEYKKLFISQDSK